MHSSFKYGALAAAVCFVLGAPAAYAQEEAPHVKPVTEYIKKNVQPWLVDAVVIKAVKDANAKHANVSYDEIVAWDKAWAEKNPELLNATMKNALSEFLTKKKEASKGVITEAFVMDDKGLNVGQTDGTSDYFQADEAKWQKTYGSGEDAIFVDKVEEDGGVKVAQTSVTIMDKGKPVGAITFGIDVDKLPKK
jgi:opacity protein-like surface antigen